jgi:hypothetical protein
VALDIDVLFDAWRVNKLTDLRCLGGTRGIINSPDTLIMPFFAIRIVVTNVNIELNRPIVPRARGMMYLAGEYSFNQSVSLVLAFLKIFFTYLQDDMIAVSTLLNGRQRNM